MDCARLMYCTKRQRPVLSKYVKRDAMYDILWIYFTSKNTDIAPAIFCPGRRKIGSNIIIDVLRQKSCL